MKTLTGKSKTAIVSILTQHMLLFGSGIIEFNRQVEYESNELIKALTDSRLNPAYIHSIISIIRQHSLIFGEGIISSERKVTEKNERLIGKLRKLLANEDREVPGLIPRVNYLNFKRKIMETERVNRLDAPKPELKGLPLFGKKRIDPETIKKGHLFLFRLAKNHQNSPAALIHVISIKKRGDVRYRQDNTIVATKNHIHTILITDNNESDFGTGKVFKTAFGIPVKSSNFLTIRTRNYFNIYISGMPHSPLIKRELKGDPSRKEYSFFFPQSSKSFSNITHFLTELIIRATRISHGEADNISYFITKKIFREDST